MRILWVLFGLLNLNLVVILLAQNSMHSNYIGFILGSNLSLSKSFTVPLNNKSRLSDQSIRPDGIQSLQITLYGLVTLIIILGSFSVLTNTRECQPNSCLLSPATTLAIYMLHTLVKYLLLYNFLFIYFTSLPILHKTYLKHTFISTLNLIH